MPPKAVSARTENEQALARTSYARLQSFFQVPAPIRSLFESIPIVIYAPNELPRRRPKQSELPSLYVFGSDDDVRSGRPSFNPSCLRWQVSSGRCATQVCERLTFHGIDFPQNSRNRPPSSLLQQPRLANWDPSLPYPSHHHSVYTRNTASRTLKQTRQVRRGPWLARPRAHVHALPSIPIPP